MPMHKNFIRIASILGILAVALGAFGAHGLKSVLDAKLINTYEVGIRYHFYHTLALLLVAILYNAFPTKWLQYAGYFFIAGIFCFSGSLYLLACRFILGIESWVWLGPITPIGGLFFMLGWTMIFVTTLGTKK